MSIHSKDMKIAFVGKGGSGKTTASSLFTQYLSYNQPVLGVDADINMHMAELFDIETDKSTVISEKQPSELIRAYLMGDNKLIASTAHFKKSTPPGAGSQLVNIRNPDDWFMSQFSRKVTDNLSVVVVGTYSEEGIASSCYHNNLAILENLLSHTTDDGSVVVDMVAGTDAFASTLFAQFDVLFFVAEPTTRSLAVYRQYEALASKGGVLNRLFVVGNKVEDNEDIDFIAAQVGDKLVATLSRSKQITLIDKGRAKIDASSLSESDLDALRAIKDTAETHAVRAQDRLPLLWELHKVYVGQSYVKDRFGDLTTQIDTSFEYPKTS